MLTLKYKKPRRVLVSRRRDRVGWNYSGSIGTYCEGLPGVLLLCSASSGETSHADVMEDGIYLSNRFTRVFRSQVEANPTISLHDLYYQLATHTTASHAGLYNDACFGNIYRSTLEEFLKR